MPRNERTPGPSRGARGSQNAQLGGLERPENTATVGQSQAGEPAPIARRVALRAIHNRAGHFLGLEVVHV